LTFKEPCGSVFSSLSGVIHIVSGRDGHGDGDGGINGGVIAVRVAVAAEGANIDQHHQDDNGFEEKEQQRSWLWPRGENGIHGWGTSGPLCELCRAAGNF